MIRFKACNTVLITGVTLQNAPNVHLTLGQSGSSYGANGTISNVTIKAPSTAPNTDAVDTWYWNGIDILNCNFSVGDDNVAMNSYSQNITIKDCTFGTGHGVSVGSYTINVNNVTVDNCTFTNTTNGIRLKSNRTRGGDDSTFSYSNITMDNVKYPFYITSWYDKEPYPASAQVAAAVTATTPKWNNITFKNITVNNSPNAGIIYGLPEAYINNVVFDNVKIEATTKGLITNFVTGLEFKNCSSITIPANKGNAIVPYEATITGINTTSGVSTSCTLGIDQVQAETSGFCFPNPVKGVDFTVKANSGINKILIYNLSGEKIKEQKGNMLTQQLVNIEELSTGSYVVEVVLDNGKINKLKLIKE
jgi:polygalacturonase